MLEILLCSLVTILPDYLFRRYYQNKRIGKEITFYSVWFELRWGITGCLVLAVGLITVVFYNHPSTTNVTLFFRTVPIVPETNGRVAEVYAGFSGPIAKGAPIFRLDSSTQEAAAETARRKIAETEAEIEVAQIDIVKADGQLQEARSSHQQAVEELETKRELQKRNPGIVPFRDIEKLELVVEGRLGAITAATAAKQSATERVSAVLPAQKASAEAALAQAEVDLNKMIIRAGVSGRLEQFALRVGDIVNPIMRPAGILIPEAQSTIAAGRLRTDRSADHEDRNDRRGHLCVEALYGYPDGGHGCAGLHCRRPVSRRRATGRGATGEAAGDSPRISRAALQRRACRRNTRQQLYRQRLFQQPRFDCRPKTPARCEGWFFTLWMQLGSYTPLFCASRR